MLHTHTHLSAFKIDVLVPFVPPRARWPNKTKVARFNHHHSALSASICCCSVFALTRRMEWPHFESVDNCGNSD